MDLIQAYNIAVDKCLQLQPFCEQIKIAGSIKRQVLEVKDIEICAIPKRIQADLFGSSKVIEPEFSKAVKGLGNVVMGHPDDRYLKIDLPEGIRLDLFLPNPIDFYRIYSIRVGSRDFAQRIANAWLKKGWCGSDKGLRQIKDCVKQVQGEKVKWKCVNVDAELPPTWKSEEEFFEWLGIQWVHPRLRK